MKKLDIILLKSLIFHNRDWEFDEKIITLINKKHGIEISQQGKLWVWIKERNESYDNLTYQELGYILNKIINFMSIPHKINREL